MPQFTYSELLPLGADTTKYRLVSKEGVSVIKLGDKEFLQIEPSALEKLTAEAIHDISHYLRSDHLAQLENIVKDPESSPNDRFVAIDLLKNANIAAGGVLPMCQDTGTALVMGKKGQYVLTTSKDEVAISQGIYDAYTQLNLRYSQMAPVTTWEEKTLAIICQHKLRFIQTVTIQMNTTCFILQRVAEVRISPSYIKKPKPS